MAANRPIVISSAKIVTWPKFEKSLSQKNVNGIIWLKVGKKIYITEIKFVPCQNVGQNIFILGNNANLC